MNSIQSLAEAIHTICTKSNIHICIHDLTGILSNTLLKINYNNQIHSKNFCFLAKTTSEGYDLCIKSKILANKKAIEEQIQFSGYCPYGLYEIVKPVIIGGKTVCIIYIGNMIQDKEYTVKKIEYACAITKSPMENMIQELEYSEVIADIQDYIDIANLIDSYIHLLYDHFGYNINGGRKEYHHIIKALLDYSKLHYNQNITLQTMSKLYYINEKYLGKLFKDQTGYSFHQYLNNIRLEKSTSLLINSDDTILSVALKCGFNNVTYFNRLFLQNYNMSPKEYREKHYPNM